MNLKPIIALGVNPDLVALAKQARHSKMKMNRHRPFKFAYYLTYCLLDSLLAILNASIRKYHSFLKVCCVRILKLVTRTAAMSVTAPDTAYGMGLG